jgi:hypothetical protein
MHLLHGDRAVISAVKAAVEQMNRMGIPYADVFSPLSDAAMAKCCRRLTIAVRGEPLGDRDVEAVSPPIFGRYMMIVSTDLSAERSRFALRHGVGHVVGGHVTEPRYLSDRNEVMHFDERVADLFALADLVPFYFVADCRSKQHMSWRAIRHEICKEIRLFTGDWPELRVADRADLRLHLYREHGL